MTKTTLAQNASVVCSYNENRLKNSFPSAINTAAVLYFRIAEDWDHTSNIKSP